MNYNLPMINFYFELLLKFIRSLQILIHNILSYNILISIISMDKSKCTLLEWVINKPSVLEVLQITKYLHQLFGEIKQYQSYPSRSWIFINKSPMSISIQKPQYGHRYIGDEYSYLQLHKYDKLLVISNYLAYMLTGTLVNPIDKIENLKKCKTDQRLIDFVQKCQKYDNMKVNFDQQIDYLINHYIKQQMKNKALINEKIKQQNQDQHLKVIEQYTKLKDYDRALKYINNLEENVKNNWIILNAKGIVYQFAGNFLSAEKYFKLAENQKLSHIPSHNLASLYFLWKDHLVQYQQILQKLIKDKNVPEKQKQQYNQYMADCKQIRMQSYQRRQIFQKLWTQTKQPKYLLKIAQTYLEDKQKNYAQAMKKYYQSKKYIEQQRQALKEKQNRSRTYNQSQRQTNNPSSQTQVNTGKQDYRQLYKWQKQICDLNLLYLEAYLDKKVDTFTRVKDIHLQNTGSNISTKAYAIELMKTGDYQSAKQTFFQILNSYGNDFQVLWNIAKCLFELKSRECFIYFSKCIEIDPNRSVQVSLAIQYINQYFEENNIGSNCGKQQQKIIQKIIQDAKKKLRR